MNALLFFLSLIILYEGCTNVYAYTKLQNKLLQTDFVQILEILQKLYQLLNLKRIQHKLCANLFKLLAKLIFTVA